MKLKDVLRRIRARTGRQCQVCEDGTLMAPWVFNRPRACNCGAGPGQLVLHDYRCDTVPCPFCPGKTV